MPPQQASDAPLISVVIPVYGVRQYLPDCLDSVLGQSSEVQIEVIAVDDASPDGCGALLDERAKGDDRLTVVHHDKPGGPGNARNAGLARATGRYVWFVDGDDLLASGAISAAGSALIKSWPDVLLIDYREFFPHGHSSASPGAELLAQAPPGLFTLSDAPQVINLTMTAWSKLLRTEFLVRLAEPFRAGIHEDIPVTCAALLTGQLMALDQVCYCYRRARPGSFMATKSSAHLAVFEAYAEVFTMVHKLVAAGDPVATSAVQNAVFERAIWHYTAVLQTPGLVPRAERRRFFELMHADFVQYAPPGYQLPGGARGAKFGLIQADRYLTYELLEPLNHWRIRVRGILRRLVGRPA
jgi:CDP-glycerol glycerophosphotransferase